MDGGGGGIGPYERIRSKYAVLYPPGLYEALVLHRLFSATNVVFYPQIKNNLSVLSLFVYLIPPILINIALFHLCPYSYPF
jgi:hypothetical protein